MAGRNVLKLYVTADGKVAVRTFDEVASASDRTAGKVEKDAERQTHSFQKIEESSGRLRGAVGGLAATIGAGGLAFGIADVVKAGETWQGQQGQLSGALQSVHIKAKGALDGIRSAADALSTRGGFATSQQIPGLATFVRVTGSASQAIRDNALATDLARGRSIGLAQAQGMIAMALTGNVGRLQKYIGVLDRKSAG